MSKEDSPNPEIETLESTKEPMKIEFDESSSDEETIGECIPTI